MQVSTLRKLRHQNILLFMGACVSPPHFAIVTKFCTGSTLYRHIHVLDTQFEMDHIIDMLTQLTQGIVHLWLILAILRNVIGQTFTFPLYIHDAPGMEYLHARRVVKRKLTTKSVFVEMDGKVMIGDFSLATLTALPMAMTSTRAFNGSSPYMSPTAASASSMNALGKICPPRYLAPEILATSDPTAFTYKSDVYAFGVVAFEVLAKNNPWPGLLPEQLIYSVVVKREKPDFSACRADCPSALLDLVSSCLGKLS